MVTGEVVPDADILAEADAAPAGEAVRRTTPGHSAAAECCRRARSWATERRSDPSLQGAAIAALLEEADAAELSLHRPGGLPGLSTESPDFAELLEQLGTGLRGPADHPPQQPQTGSGRRPPPASGPQPRQPAPSRSLPGTRYAVRAPRTGPSGRAALRESVPAPLSGVGDLVVLVGLGDDAHGHRPGHVHGRRRRRCAHGR